MINESRIAEYRFLFHLEETRFCHKTQCAPYLAEYFSISVAEASEIVAEWILDYATIKRHLVPPPQEVTPRRSGLKAIVGGRRGEFLSLVVSRITTLTV